MARASEIPRLLLFVSATGVGTALDLGVVVALRRIPGLPLVLAVAGGWLANTSAGYLLNRLVVFRDGTASNASSVWRYACLVLLNALVGIVGVSCAVHLGAPYLLARLVSSASLVVINLSVARSWVFRVPVQAAPLGHPTALPVPPSSND